MASPYAGGVQSPSPAAAAAAAQQQQNHSLAFRVMRLSRPSLQPDPIALLRFDPRDVFLPEDALTGTDPSAAADFLHRLLHPTDSATAVPGDFTFRDRFLLRDHADALALPGLLVLPQSFGAIYLGETFCSYISINNSSCFEARDVVIKAEIQTERQRILLLDTTKSPVESIRSGGRYDFIVEHDVKELGAHTLVCTALYNDGDGERKYLPQFFKFSVSNPLSVRTKVTSFQILFVRTIKVGFFWFCNCKLNSTRLEADEHPAVKSAIGDLCKQPILIRAGGGIYNYLYQLKSSSDETGQPKTEGSSILGKFQITWRTNLGEPGRLQTQNIHSTPTASKDVDLRAVKVPPIIYVERPFMILPLVEAFESFQFDLSMVATQLGVQKISGITMYAVQEKKYYEPLPDIEIFVDAE
nr:unnamed protein product [Digitaria exilis]